MLPRSGLWGIKAFLRTGVKAYCWLLGDEFKPMVWTVLHNFHVFIFTPWEAVGCNWNQAVNLLLGFFLLLFLLVCPQQFVIESNKELRYVTGSSLKTRPSNQIIGSFQQMHVSRTSVGFCGNKWYMAMLFPSLSPRLSQSTSWNTKDASMGMGLVWSEALSFHLEGNLWHLSDANPDLMAEVQKTWEANGAGAKLIEGWAVAAYYQNMSF